MMVGWSVVVFFVAEYSQMDAESEGFLYRLTLQ